MDVHQSCPTSSSWATTWVSSPRCTSPSTSVASRSWSTSTPTSAGTTSSRTCSTSRPRTWGRSSPGATGSPGRSSCQRATSTSGSMSPRPADSGRAEQLLGCPQRRGGAIVQLLSPARPDRHLAAKPSPGTADLLATRLGYLSAGRCGCWPSASASCSPPDPTRCRQDGIRSGCACLVSSRRPTSSRRCLAGSPSWCARRGSWVIPSVVSPGMVQQSRSSRPVRRSPARAGLPRPGRGWPWRTVWACG